MAATSTIDVSLFHHTPFYCEENVYLLCKKLCDDGIANSEGSDLFVAFISNEKKQIPLWNQKASQRADGVILWDYHVICIQINQGGGCPQVWDLDSSLPFPSPLASYVSETIRPSFQLFSDYNSLEDKENDGSADDYGASDLNFYLENQNQKELSNGWKKPKKNAPNIRVVIQDLSERLSKLFRIVHAPIFLRSFASDRRHMKGSDGHWIEEPPPHEPIVAQDGTVHNLNEYFNISSSDAVADIRASSVKDAVFTQKHGVVIKENQLEELFSQISSK